MLGVPSGRRGTGCSGLCAEYGKRQGKAELPRWLDGSDGALPRARRRASLGGASTLAFGGGYKEGAFRGGKPGTFKTLSNLGTLDAAGSPNTPITPGSTGPCPHFPPHHPLSIQLVLQMPSHLES